jgi:hypothetical protein
MFGSCIPMSTNSTAFSRKTMNSHTANPCIRICTVETCGAIQPR